MRALLPLVLVLSGCTAIPLRAPAFLGGGTLPAPDASGFVGPDLLATASNATALQLAVPQTDKGLTVAVDPAGRQVAYANPDGIYVAEIGGTARKLAPWHGSVRELTWSEDGTTVLISENEVEAKCVVDARGGTQCSSSSADDYGRLEAIAVADGSVKTLAEHVYGLHDLAARGKAVAYLGRVGQAPSLTAGFTLYVADVAGTTPPEEVLKGALAGRFAWSPDGQQIGYTSGDYTTGVTKPQLAVFSPGTKAGRTLGEVGAADLMGPCWSADGTKLRMLMTSNRNEVGIQEFPLDGQPTQAALSFGNDQDLIQGAVFNAPDGKRLVGTGASFSTHAQQLVVADLDAKQVTPLAPAGRIWQWVGSDQLLVSVGHTWLQHYYLVKVPR